MIVGYTCGVYDLFHIGHLNVLKNARELCDKLIVGVSVDELVSYKGKTAVIPFQERIELVRNIGFVDCAVAQRDIDKFLAWQKLKYDVLFVGDDWFGNESWKLMEEKLKAVNVKVVYLPYTQHTSSTILRETIAKLNEKS